jgi:alkylhydroperoxidase family enzyme
MTRIQALDPASTSGKTHANLQASVREAGATDAELLEVVALVALNIFTNYLNIVADTEIDFPVVRSAVR